MPPPAELPMARAHGRGLHGDAVLARGEHEDARLIVGMLAATACLQGRDALALLVAGHRLHLRRSADDIAGQRDGLGADLGHVKADPEHAAAWRGRCCTGTFDEATHRVQQRLGPMRGEQCEGVARDEKVARWAVVQPAREGLFQSQPERGDSIVRTDRSTKRRHHHRSAREGVGAMKDMHAAL